MPQYMTMTMIIKFMMHVAEDELFTMSSVDGVDAAEVDHVHDDDADPIQSSSVFSYPIMPDSTAQSCPGVVRSEGFSSRSCPAGRRAKGATLGGARWSRESCI